MANGFQDKRTAVSVVIQRCHAAVPLGSHGLIHRLCIWPAVIATDTVMARYHQNNPALCWPGCLAACGYMGATEQNNSLLMCHTCCSVVAIVLTLYGVVAFWSGCLSIHKPTKPVCCAATARHCLPFAAAAARRHCQASAGDWPRLQYPNLPVGSPPKSLLPWRGQTTAAAMAWRYGR